MVAKARELHGEGDDRQWRVGAEPADCRFCDRKRDIQRRGDVESEVWIGYVRRTLDVLAQAGRSGFAFNVLSMSSDPDRRRSNLYYADPAGMLDYCLSRYGRSVALLQDYGLYEFPILVRHAQVKT